MSGNLRKATQTLLRASRSYPANAYTTSRPFGKKPDKGGKDSEDKDPNQEEGEKGKKVAKGIGSVVLKTCLISGAVIGGTAVALPIIGFGASGAIAGSLAATYQSAVLGGTIASGSAFATLQTVGMVGLSAAAKTVIVGGSAVLSAVTTAAKKARKNKKSEM